MGSSRWWAAQQQPPEQQPELWLPERCDLWLPPPQQEQQPLRCRRRLLGKQQQPVELEPQQPLSPQQPPPLPQQPPSEPEPQQPPPQHGEEEPDAGVGAGAGQGVGPCEDPLEKPLAEAALCWDMAELVTADLEESQPLRREHAFFFPTVGLRACRRGSASRLAGAGAREYRAEAGNDSPARSRCLH